MTSNSCRACETQPARIRRSFRGQSFVTSWLSVAVCVRLKAVPRARPLRTNYWYELTAKLVAWVVGRGLSAVGLLSASFPAETRAARVRRLEEPTAGRDKPPGAAEADDDADGDGCVVERVRGDR